MTDTFANEDYGYDFCLPEDLNEKLVKAVKLLDEVHKSLGRHIFSDGYVETGFSSIDDFIADLGSQIDRLKMVIRGLDQDPIV